MLTTCPRVWIVDDDTDDQYLFEIAFKRLVPPVEIKLLDDGEELIPALMQTSDLPNLIILDLNMPRLNGFETLKQLRQTPPYQHVPVIVLTTSSHREDQEKAARLGANGFLTKPPSMDLLLVLFGQLVQDWELS
ncbi:MULTISPECIES: response regulator [Spirosoma]|uniref:Response regulator n=1 Tax=Spirosoma liriopis TaxID=2937440 RepID=A0ABT0HR09_9BACT|nr:MULTISPECIES: response regulator [Spirosoma]MCK8493985.1 response regulator [Spirosoma liriopis]UHG89004.1 response regulator [Spirosoma oryzicola]